MKTEIINDSNFFKELLNEFPDSNDPLEEVKKKYGWEVLCDMEDPGSDIAYDLSEWINKGQGKTYKILYYDVFIIIKEVK